MEIIVLGTGCAKCQQVYQLIDKVITTHQLEATLRKIEDMGEIMQYNVLALPAVVINNKVAIKGRIPSEKELEQLLIKSEDGKK